MVSGAGGRCPGLESGLAQACLDLWQIAGMLGHKDTRMVERIYAKHHPDFQKRATEALDRLVPVDEPRAICAPAPAIARS